MRGIVQQSRAAGAASGPEAQFLAPLAELMRTHGADYPAMTAALASTAETGGQDQALDFGLDRILDGLGALIAQRADRA
ncbi:TetR/AcrR family transcriptional regulator C-terminal domain-containing protein [Kitasatospora sp. NPDC001175]|uniref:TetR/AcrR family transcriptional regulator C-terminal domain-containing protein n=1 Tax=Kitasatospora sp. NPDC001175 TaxID=3157103 RepID=UPI003CFD9BDD